MAMRLDKRVLQDLNHLSRTVVQNLITRGAVCVDGVVVRKPGVKVADAADVVVDMSLQDKYVSRAGYKLEAALAHGNIKVEGLVCLDAGLSTGGFTDCLLQHGAAKVYGVDVGTDQVHETIRNDKRVVVMEQTNLKDVEKLPDAIDLVTLDVSFISLTKVFPAVVRLLAPGARVICLIKPQFEAGKQLLRRGGKVTDPKVHQTVIELVTESAREHELSLVCSVIESPLLGAASGNTEFLGIFSLRA